MSDGGDEPGRRNGNALKLLGTVPANAAFVAWFV
jgi:hypothetical protein